MVSNVYPSSLPRNSICSFRRLCFLRNADTTLLAVQTLRALWRPSPPISHAAHHQSSLAQPSDWIQIWFFRHGGHLLSQSLDICHWSHPSVIHKPGPLTSLRPLLRYRPPRKGSLATPVQATARLPGSLSVFRPPMLLFPWASLTVGLWQFFLLHPKCLELCRAHGECQQIFVDQMSVDHLEKEFLCPLSRGALGQQGARGQGTTSMGRNSLLCEACVSLAQRTESKQGLRHSN